MKKRNSASCNIAWLSPWLVGNAEGAGRADRGFLDAAGRASEEHH